MNFLQRLLKRKGSRKWRGAMIPACVAFASLAVPVHAQMPGARATPFPAWEEPKIDPNMTLELAKVLVAQRTRKQTEWKGPTTGPKAPKQELTLAWDSGEESYTSYIYWGNGIKEAAKALAGMAG